jgi:hypothetical protein
MTSERHSLLVGKRRLLVAFRIIVVLVVVAVGLAGACGVLWFRLRGAIDRDALVDRPDVREAAVAELVERAQGNWDSHPGPDVGRVLLPNLQARFAADDFAYLGDDLRLCGAFRLQLAEVLP